MSADSLIAFILLGCIFMFAIGITISSWIERAWGGLEDTPAVKPSPTEGTSPHADYVNTNIAGNPRSARSPWEREPEREPERVGEPEPLPRPLTGTLYTEEQIEKRERVARDKGAAEAMGLFLGLGLVPAAHESAIMAALFGPRGRRHQVARAIITDTAATAAPPPQADAVAIRVNAGTTREYEVPR